MESTLRKDTTDKTLSRALEKVPQHLRNSVEGKLRLYQDVAFEQKQMWRKNENTKLEIEEVFVGEIEKWEKTQKGHFALNYWLHTPVNSFINLVKSSHLNHYIFQKTLRGNYFVEFLRIISVVIVLTSLFSSIVLLFIEHVSTPDKIVMLSVLVSILYLVLIQRMNETRYMTPYLPLIFTAFCLFYNRLIVQRNKPNA
jgi:hypothetical protein